MAGGWLDGGGVVGGTKALGGAVELRRYWMFGGTAVAWETATGECDDGPAISDGLQTVMTSGIMFASRMR